MHFFKHITAQKPMILANLKKPISPACLLLAAALASPISSVFAERGADNTSITSTATTATNTKSTPASDTAQNNNIEDQDDALWQQFRSHRAPKALIDWINHEDIALQTIQDPIQRTRAYYELGKAHHTTRNHVQAQIQFEHALKILNENPGNDILRIQVQNDLGLALVSQENPIAALRHFQNAHETALELKEVPLIILTGLNWTRSSLDAGLTSRVPILLDSIHQHMAQMPETSSSASDWISLGRLIQQAASLSIIPSTKMSEALSTFQRAETLAKAQKDLRTLSYAKGYMGQLYGAKQNSAAALSALREAVFYAQAIGDRNALFQWQSHIAQLLHQNHQYDEAISQYEHAVETLKTVRQAGALAHGLRFQENVKPVFLALADALLQKAKKIEDPAEQQKLLTKTIETLETVKLAEVQNFFDDTCLIPEEQIKLNQVMGNSAIIYPVILADRLEILVQLQSGITRLSTPNPVDAKTLTITANEFRLNIQEDDADNKYLLEAQKLYNWIIQPAEKLLKQAKIKTLVFVPDGPLRSIPMSALHDGKHFLIREYAIATTPTMSLTAPKPLDKDNISILANGLSGQHKEIEDMPNAEPLPYVKTELDSISAAFPSLTRAENTHYALANVTNAIATTPHNVLHFATHGKFERDHRQSFLLTYDGKLTMDHLETAVQQRRLNADLSPIEMIVLSACQTALGDDRAALGLAGVAIQAGARSALASLWLINDKASAELIGDFYHHLKAPEHNKAQALQAAQLKLIDQPKHNHPSYWAPFLMIGNWL